MKVLLNRLRARLDGRGESIVEVLTAIIICSLAVLMLYTALASAAHMNAQADQRSAAYWDDISMVEAQIPNDPRVFGEVHVSGVDEYYEVEYFTGETGAFSSYRML